MRSACPSGGTRASSNVQESVRGQDVYALVWPEGWTAGRIDAIGQVENESDPGERAGEQGKNLT